MINDTYGHSIGDQVLAISVRHVMAHLRPYDSVFRYGGDEFLVCLPNADLRLTQTVIDRIREELASLGAATGMPEAITATASFGITQLDPDSSVEESINRADTALYAAKASGRNCSRAWDPTMPQERHGESST
jgi:diguanylate cyclase (GGDEF)-like protein